MRKGLVTGLKRALLYFMLLLHIGIVNVFCYLSISVFVLLCYIVSVIWLSFYCVFRGTELERLSSSVAGSAS